jgi:large subunit ribosomal protein L9
MATEVLLMENVADLGSEGEVVKVADGYARNYLIPRELAAPVSEATRRRLAKLQQQREAARQQSLEAARQVAAKLASASCTIPVKAGDDQKLYGSVTAVDVAAALASQGFAVDKSEIELEAPIKELGIYNIPVALHGEVKATIKVWVVEE